MINTKDIRFYKLDKVTKEKYNILVILPEDDEKTSQIC